MRLLHLLAPLLISGVAFAQATIQGTAGSDYLPGTAGSDGIHDGGGHGDLVHDNADPSRSDGQCDAIFTEDGLVDTIIAGPEDILFVDDIDKVILRDANGNDIFVGTGKGYKFLKHLILAIEYWIYDLQESFSTLWAAYHDLLASNTDEELEPAIIAAGQYLAQLELQMIDGGAGE